MAQNFYIEGNVAAWVNETERDVKSGDPVLFGERVVVATVDIPKNSMGTVSLVNVYILPKVAGQEIKQGQKCFLTTDFHISGTEEGQDLPFAGIAFVHSPASEPTVKLRLGY